MLLFQIPVQHFNCYVKVALVMKTVPKTWRNGWRGIRNLLFPLCMKRVNFNSLGQKFIEWHFLQFSNSQLERLMELVYGIPCLFSVFPSFAVLKMIMQLTSKQLGTMESRNDAVWKCSMNADNKQPKTECFFRFLSYSYRLALHSLGSFIWQTLGGGTSLLWHPHCGIQGEDDPVPSEGPSRPGYISKPGNLRRQVN